MNSASVADSQLSKAGRRPRGATDNGSPLTIAIAVYTACGLALLYFATMPGPVIPGLTAVFAAGVFATELSTSFLLFIRFRAVPSASILVLAAAYLYSACLTVPYLLTFPGALVPHRPLIGTAHSTAWIFIPWIFGFAALTLAAIILEVRQGDRQLTARNVGSAAAATVIGVLALVALVTYNALALTDWMPLLIADGHWTAFDRWVSYSAMAMFACGIVIVLVAIHRSNELFLWLGLALTAMLFSNVLSTFGGGRYTVGWSASRVSWVLSGCAVFLYFLLQFARQQRLLLAARDALEKRVIERTADLTNTVKERDLLLREVHHRVRNNFQTINSLINFQASRAQDANTRAALAELHGRISALGLVHQQLMQSNDLATFSMRPFLENLCSNVALWSDATTRGITIAIDAEPLQTDFDFASAFGLLVTELLLDAFYRYGDHQHGTIRIALHAEADSSLQLTVAAQGASARDTASTGDHSVRIRQALLAQLGGRLETTDDAATVRVILPAPAADDEASTRA